MKKTSFFSAFTFAELLLVLIIIGVISAFTIPTLNTHADEKKFVSLVNKAYSDISNATATLEIQHGNIQFWDWTNAYSWYKQILNVDTNADLASWISTNHTKLNGDANSLNASVENSFMTLDGMCWTVSDRTIYVDVNCSTSPNIIGIDVHSFYAENDGIYPSGSKGINPAFSCTAYVIKYGEMPWYNSTTSSCPAI